MTRQQQISRQCGLGIPHTEIAAEFGISVRDVQRIDAKQREIQAIAARRVAGSYQAPEPITWRTIRPAAERLLTGDECRAPDGCCEKRVRFKSYCEGHLALYCRKAVAA